MAEASSGITADTSSYKLPTTSPFDIAKNIGGLEQQRLGITQQKLDQAEQAVNYLSRGMSAIGPNGTPEQYERAAADTAKLFNLPPQSVDVFRQKMMSYKNPQTGQFDSSRFYDELQGQRATHIENFNQYRGQLQATQTGQGTQYTRIPGSPNMPVAPVGSVQQQIPPTANVRGPENEPQMYGTEPTAPFVPGGGLRSRTAPPLAPGAMNPALVPGMRPGERATSVQVMPAQTGRVPGPSTGLPPGEQEAASASGQQLAQERLRAAAFQRDTFPLQQAIPALEALGTKGTGPGTETINHLKSFVLSNLPGVKESDFNGTVADYDKAKKYLTDFVNQTGNSGTNDKLAAAFAGNPSVGISNAATVDVAKSALALRRMSHAVYQDIEKQGLPAYQFSRAVAQRMNNIDPRAFGTDMMKDEAKAKLREQLNKNPTEAKNFRESLELAQRTGFLTPSK